MANLSITAANVRMTATSAADFIIAGESLTPGQPAYLNSLDNRYYKTIADDTEQKAEAAVIVTGYGVAGARVPCVRGGSVVIGATLVPQTLYVVSATSGAICPIADLATDDWVTLLGLATTTTEMNLIISPQRYQVA